MSEEKQLQSDYSQLIEKARAVVNNTSYPSATTLSKDLKISIDQAIQLFDTLREMNIINENSWRVGKKIDQVFINALEKTSDLRKNVIAVRVTEQVNEILEDLVTFSISQSKSEAAFMLIIEGIKAQSNLLAKLNAQKNTMEDIKNRILNETEGISDFGRM